MIIRPYDMDDTMHMVGHDDPFIDDGMWIMRGDLLPTIGSHAPCVIQRHAAIDDRAEQRTTVLRTYGDKIESRLRIIVPLQAY